MLHYHFHDVATGALIDVPVPEVEFSKLPAPPRALKWPASTSSSGDAQETVAVLEAVEIETGRNPTGYCPLAAWPGRGWPLISLHRPQLVTPDERPLRFIFPHAPVRPVTVNGGAAMRAWYDILGFNREFPRMRWAFGPPMRKSAP